MKRTTVSLPDEVARLLEREARIGGTSVSDVARRALISYFGLGETRARQLPFASLGASGYEHTAREMEAILAEEWDTLRGR